MDYQDMIIEASDDQREVTSDKRRLLRFKVRVIVSPAGEMAADSAIGVEIDERELRAALQNLEARKLEQGELIALGKTLAALLLPPVQDGTGASIRDLFKDSLVLAVSAGSGLRLRLRLPLQLAVLPWEYMYADRAGGGDGMDGFLALDPRVAIVRHEVLTASAQPAPASGDIKAVVALTSGDGPVLNLASERAVLEKAFQGQDGITPEFIDNATLAEVTEAAPGAGIFHFAGHGTFDTHMSQEPGVYTGTGTISLEDRSVDAEELGIGLRGEGIRLAVLGACESGRRDAFNPWSGIAAALTKAEIPAVIANQYSIEDRSAVAFIRAFYQGLAGGLNIEHAVSRGRIAAYHVDADGRDWGVPVLYLRAANGQLFEGAADKGQRASARAQAEADISVRVNEIAPSGEVLGSSVRQMLGGKMTIGVRAGTVHGTLTGGEFGELIGGNVNVDMDVETVTGRVTGARFDRFRGAPRADGGRQFEE